MPYSIPNFINGAPIYSNHADQQNVFNPATGQIIATVNFASGHEINEALAAASMAFPSWSTTPPIQRARILFRFRELLESHLAELAEIITREHGKILEDAKGSVLRAIELVEFFCGVPHLLKGDFSQNVSSEIDSYSLRQALGVCVGISPFNFPVMVPIWMMIPAIACGNTFILKPSEQDPSAPVKIMELLKAAGLPDGVANLVQGDKSTVETLIKHPLVAAVSCVGSTPVAESIYHTAIAHGKRAQTFGGAKNHCIVMPDADLALTAKAIAASAYGAAGERCMAISAVAAMNPIADQLISLLKQEITGIVVGPGQDSKSHMGPLVTSQHRQRVLDYIDTGVKEGANLIVDGRNLKIKDYPNGFFLGPSLFDHVNEQMRIYREEIFGPVLVVLRAEDFAKAIELVNKHEYGNGVAIFTRDGGVARNFAAAVKVGMVGINVPIPVPAAFHGFGGWKRSWFGDTRMHLDSIHFYTQSKSVVVRWPNMANYLDYFSSV
ncbi:MAG: CoA-acylating methylmalonate-semialdehyde dehydrogenase [Proteobacteria bacterium]|nr:CoA-acylating methylmalonate-semialdehyde dehydrogenase [Pseudomonadota bacterium]